MIPGWTFILAVLVYLCALFTIAHYGDTRGREFVRTRGRATIYALTLGVYCTSWTFFGSVGFASSAGLDFLTIYIGPFLVIVFGQRLIARVIALAKSQNITSIADFIAARYGKSQAVAALVATIAVIGVVPYIALQLKAISVSLTTVLGSLAAGHVVTADAAAGGAALPVAMILAGFAIAFGTRRVDATEHQDGLMLAIAVESIVKLVSFLAVGLYTTFGLFNGFADLAGRAVASAPIRTLMLHTPDAGTWITMNLLSACAILLLPRQFHVMIVENRNERDVRTAGRLFPLYLIAINLFVVPIAIAGLVTFPDGAIDRDMTVLALPIVGHAGIVTLVTLIGGLSAATAMVIVACVALSIMVSNDLVMPLLLRRSGGAVPILAIRRIAILGIVCLGYVYVRTAGDAALASIGLLSFAAIAQIAPAFFGALFWDYGDSALNLLHLSGLPWFGPWHASAGPTDAPCRLLNDGRIECTVTVIAMPRPNASTPPVSQPATCAASCAFAPATAKIATVKQRRCKGFIRRPLESIITSATFSFGGGRKSLSLKDDILMTGALYSAARCIGSTSRLAGGSPRLRLVHSRIVWNVT